MSALNEKEKGLWKMKVMITLIVLKRKKKMIFSLRGRRFGRGQSFPPASNYFVAMETNVFDESRLNGVLAVLTGCS